MAIEILILEDKFLIKLALVSGTRLLINDNI